jgi:DNA polymerase
MLSKMLLHVLGLERNQVYILNVVKCRPEHNRKPEQDEIEACRPFLQEQIAAVDPKIILTLGATAVQALMQTQRGVTSLRGDWMELDGRPLMPTFHPAYLLRKPEHKGLVFEDLKAVRARYDALGGQS